MPDTSYFGTEIFARHEKCSVAWVMVENIRLFTFRLGFYKSFYERKAGLVKALN